MASQNPTGDGAAVAPEISPRKVAILRPILEMVRDGANDDFSTPLAAGRPDLARADEHAYRVLRDGRELRVAVAGGGKADEPIDSDRVDEEAVAIAAERIRSGAADEGEDGAEVLELLGIRVSEDGDEKSR